MPIPHWVDKNSVKLYNDQNVFRFEMTMNNPGKYIIYRNIQGNNSFARKLLPMRKGISDIAVRAKVSDDRIKSLTEHISAIENKSLFMMQSLMLLKEKRPTERTIEPWT